MSKEFEKGAVVKVDDELSKVKQQLAIAVAALEEYASEDNWVDCHAGFLDNSIDYGCYGYYAYINGRKST